MVLLLTGKLLLRLLSMDLVLKFPKALLIHKIIDVVNPSFSSTFSQYGRVHLGVPKNL